MLRINSQCYLASLQILLLDFGENSQSEDYEELQCLQWIKFT